MKWYVLGVIALFSINPLLDWIVDKQFKQHHESVGYTHQARMKIEAIVRSAAEPHTAKRPDRTMLVRPKNEAELAEIMRGLYGEGRNAM